MRSQETIVWEWKRTSKKHFLQFIIDGKKKGTVKELGWYPKCSCFPSGNCLEPSHFIEREPAFVAYFGGKKLGVFKTAVNAKLRVEEYYEIARNL